MTSAKPTFQSPTWKGLGSQVSPYQPSDPLPPSRPQTEGGTYRTRGVFPPDEAVEDKADAEDDARVQSCCLQEESQRKRKHLTHQPDVPLERVHPWDKTHVEEVSLLLQDKDTELGRILDNPLCSSTCSDVAFSVQLKDSTHSKCAAQPDCVQLPQTCGALSTDLAISKPG